ncbi:uncharacterized protein EHS24_007904 [Apiotrichum porosum]|uniref:Uncharacterized protein n=1 Tax=Apiotrichum porosum TaxID=105984 RepID=A0A427XSB6_9TREE|nr:uncharacterized protein EHS24_007904 [Apiotrichum porosum]RSH81715.1 hypothetical protein EHS24_007904 [Apiotrichum porosum]
MADTPKEDSSKYTFTPIHPFEMDAPKTWGGTIGQLNWDTDKIVFSKRSLLEFLKSCQLTVNTNYTEIQKLYATFGRLSQAATDAAVADLVEAEIADPSHDDEPKSGSTGARPSRKVVDPPGGKQNIRLFGEEYEETDALSLAPPPNGGSGVDVDIERMEHLKVHVEPEVDGGATVTDIKDAAASAADNSADRVSNPPSNFRPSRKVREGPGGATSLGAAFFGGYEDETDADREAARAPSGGKKPANQQSSGNLW